MFLLSLFRIIKFSLQDIRRNIWLSIITIIILVLSLFSINTLFAVKVISDSAISIIEDKVDISLYLKSDINKDELNKLKSKISQLSQVKEIIYTSKAEALQDFQAKNKHNTELMQALIELGSNPLSPSLVVKPHKAEQGEELISELRKINDDAIESRNFTDHKKMINAISSITKKINTIGTIVSLIFIFITLLVIFNTVRISIYTHNKEIGIMRLVGASNSFIYMPFLVSSIIYTLISVILSTMIFYAGLNFLEPFFASFFQGFDINIMAYFQENSFRVFGFGFLSIALINVIASLLAVRKYAKV